MLSIKFHQYRKMNNSHLFLNDIRLVLIINMSIILGCGCTSISQSNGSTEKLTSIEKSIITNQPCAAPCWYNLEVGKSTSQEVHSTLNELAFIDQRSIVDNEDVNNERSLINIRAGCIENIGQQCINFVIINNIIHEININGYHLNIEEVVNNLNSPDWIDWSPEIESTNCQIWMMWSQKKILMKHFQRNPPILIFGGFDCRSIEKSHPIDRNMNIDYISYMSPDEINNILPGRAPHYKWPGIN